jgi:hypothetical protein
MKPLAKLGFIICLSSALAPVIAGRRAAVITRDELRSEIADFLGTELAIHLSAIQSLDPPPRAVLGAGATGEYTWGTFMRALAAYAELTGQRTLAGRDLAKEVGQIGLLEHRLGGTRFSQLYAVLALRHFGRDLNRNPVWLNLSDKERAAWRKLLDVSSFYDPKSQRVINLPENYLGVAARIASTSYQLGLLKDRALLDNVLTRAARPFLNGALYADDAPPTGRYDRYSNEYARYVWEAAEMADRKDILEALRPSLRAQMRLWWDLVAPDGYGYNWGRSLGVVSYLDTLEIVAFLAQHPEFRPAPLEQLASAYYRAWRWLRRDYDDQKHMLSIFAFGRGNYSYITRDREWQQTASFFGKTALAQRLLLEALDREGISQFPSEIARSPVARFEFFRRTPRAAGVWVVRQGALHFALPITTGTKPGIADYLPAPHGLPGVAAPVEQIYPALVPFLELADGRTIVAADGADTIEPSADGRSLRVVWRRWAVIGNRAGQLSEPRITSEVTWHLDGDTIVREETLMADEEIVIRLWRCAVPLTAPRYELRFGENNERWDRFSSTEAVLELNALADWPLRIYAWATGDTPLGRGARGAIPLHLIYEARDLVLPRNKPMRWRLTLRLTR